MPAPNRLRPCLSARARASRCCWRRAEATLRMRRSQGARPAARRRDRRGRRAIASSWATSCSTTAASAGSDAHTSGGGGSRRYEQQRGAQAEVARAAQRAHAKEASSPKRHKVTMPLAWWSCALPSAHVAADHAAASRPARGHEREREGAAPPASLPWSSKRKGAGSCVRREARVERGERAPILTGNESTVHTRAVLTCKLREVTTSFGPAQSFAGSCSSGAVDGTCRERRCRGPA